MYAENLIFDIGMSEGNDTAFFLAKGFKVVGVEADTVVYQSLLSRFETELADGRLQIHHNAASDVSGEHVSFHHHNAHQGVSGLSKNPDVADEYSSFEVTTLDWRFLVERHGIPYYCKADIEGQETPFLKQLIGQSVLPKYFAVECHDLAPAALLYAIGYRKFQLVEQLPVGGFINVSPPKEGKYVEFPNWSHSSGPFGEELPGQWIDFEQFVVAHRIGLSQRHRTWFDCHVSL